jgi:hypothetical protein
MFGHNWRPVPPALFEGFNRSEEASEALDDFKGALIIAYERALEEGLSSSAALAAMLDLAAAELRRCTQLSRSEAACPASGVGDAASAAQ